MKTKIKLVKPCTINNEERPAGDVVEVFGHQARHLINAGFATMPGEEPDPAEEKKQKRKTETASKTSSGKRRSAE